ncbi:MAG: rhodanese-like domain-containing protein [Chloroflexia bacterium]|nr:rhodanese-like domain-containing protein [Chloroflexia bacterium]
MSDPIVEELTVAEFVRLEADHGFRIVDVREQEEWDAGHIQEAALIPLSVFEQRQVELDPMTPTLLVCRSGRRSQAAAEYLQSRGFGRAVNLAGGMLDWEAAGLPVER